MPDAPRHGGARSRQLSSNSVPVFIGDERVLVGKHHYEETGDDFKMNVHLNADYTALYGMTTGSEQAAFIDLTRYLTLDYPCIHNRPGSVRLEPTGTPTRDASIGFSVVAMNADESPAEGLGVTGRKQTASTCFRKHREPE